MIVGPSDSTVYQGVQDFRIVILFDGCRCCGMLNSVDVVLKNLFHACFMLLNFCG